MRAAGGLGRDQQSAERLGKGWDLCSLDNPPTNQQQIQKGDQGRKKRRKAAGLSEGQTEEIHGPEDSKPDVSLMLLCQVRTPPRRAAVSSGGEGLAAGSPQQSAGTAVRAAMGLCPAGVRSSPQSAGGPRVRRCVHLAAGEHLGGRVYLVTSGCSHPVWFPSSQAPGNTVLPRCLDFAHGTFFGLMTRVQR